MHYRGAADAGRHAAEQRRADHGELRGAYDHVGTRQRPSECAAGATKVCVPYAPYVYKYVHMYTCSYNM